MALKILGLLAFLINLVIFTILVTCIMCVLTACTPVNRELGLPDDNMWEQLIEAIIRNETGLNMDLTPESPETNDPSASR